MSKKLELKPMSYIEEGYISDKFPCANTTLISNIAGTPYHIVQCTKKPHLNCAFDGKPSIDDLKELWKVCATKTHDCNKQIEKMEEKDE